MTTVCSSLLSDKAMALSDILQVFFVTEVELIITAIILVGFLLAF